MSGKQIAEAVLKFALGVVLVGLSVFVPAGSLSFWNGWLLLGVLFLPMLVVGTFLLGKKPDLLRKRLNAKEKEKEQQLTVKLSGLMFLAGFLAAGLDFRFQWSHLPISVVIAATVMFLFGYFIYGEVLRENSYLSRTVEIQEGQQVIRTGLYKIVRHPMYAATLLLFLSMPVILGSYVSLLIFLFYPILIVNRIKHEERFLEENLKGYREYTKKVKYRLIPWIW